MNRFVVDTDVASYLFKQHPLGEPYRLLLEKSVAYLSFMTIAELDRWTITANWSEQRRRWLEIDIHATPSFIQTSIYVENGLKQ
jgi:hypothetical protein